MARRKVVASMDGAYRYRFSGFARAQASHPFHVAGLGYMTLTAGKTIKGHQFTSTMPIEGVAGSFMHNEFELDGTYKVNADASITVELQFTPKGGTKPVMKDTFRLVQSDRSGDAYWLVSTNPRDMADNRLDELVSGDVRRTI